MLQILARRIGLGIAAAILVGIGAGATLVAIAFAVYAGLKPYVGAAGASGITALVAAAVTSLGAVVLLGQLSTPRLTARAQDSVLPRGALTDSARWL